MSILCVKSRCRTRSVPTNSSCTEPVIDRASASPAISANTWMIRNSPPIANSTSSSA
jgi:hypothetical protein